MADLTSVYDDTRRSISSFALSLDEAQLATKVPATPDWTIKDVIAHLTGDAVYFMAGDFPREFFQSFGDEGTVHILNDWTERMVRERRERSVTELVDEWEASARPMLAMLRGETPMNADYPPFVDRVLITDIGVHQQDIYGALDLVRDRDAASIRIGFSGYVAMVGWRAGALGLGPLRFITEDKAYDTGEGEPAATVTAPRWELFRALSGRRSPDQIEAYDWTGNADPYIPLFYPYGVRKDPLIEPGS